jgi:hypothetical protein
MNIRKIIKEEMDSFEWVDDVNTIDSLTRDNISLGIRVKISKDSVYYDEDYDEGHGLGPENPKDVWGTVFSFDEDNVHVDWDNGEEGYYTEYDDLVIDGGTLSTYS